MSLSEKQKLACRWWCMPKFKKYDAVICDGSVRSGKTYSMSIGFVSWAMINFNGKSFGFCGKTIKSLKRNVIDNLISLLRGFGFICMEKITDNYIDIKMKNVKNRFYLFGGKDESSSSLVQGITLAGVFFDEVALMPKSFVEQAIARCSVTGSKLWFNCNPDNPAHWFYREWIKKPEKKNAFYIHFTMEDNPSLSKEVRQRYERLYSGVFYDRFVKGIWTAAEGQVYSEFNERVHVLTDDAMPLDYDKYIISCDYGTVNPSSFGLWGRNGDKWYRIDEYYYDSKREGVSRTDEEHYNALEKLAGEKPIETVIADPSAASFIECIRRHGKFKVIKADNDVVNGIRKVNVALQQRRIFFSEKCRDIIREFTLYCWMPGGGKDMPVKENDHAMDDMRYFVNTYLVYENAKKSFFVGSVSRS